MTNKSDGLVDRLWHIFSSMKLGLILLGLVALVSGMGTLIPQQSLNPQEVQAVAEVWKVLGFTAIYSSPLFLFLLGLLCINLIVCSVQRCKGIYKLTFVISPPRVKSHIPQKTNAEITGSNGDTLRQRILEVFSKRGFKITQLESENQWSFVAQKHRMGHWGSFITHISFVILLLGALTGSLTGFKGYLIAGEGSMIPIQEIYISQGQVKEDFIVKVNSVEDRILPNGERDNWYTDLSIIESGQEVLRDTLFVNHPLTYKGITFYQANYTPGAVVTVTMDGEEFPVKLQARGGNYFNVPGTNLFLILASIANNGQEPIMYYQVFNQFAELSRSQLTLGKSEIIQDTYTMTFDKVTGFTGLQVKSDPGLWIVWLGCAFLMIGLFLSFYWRPVRIAGILDFTARPLLTLGAYSGKLSMGINNEFEQIVSELVVDNTEIVLSTTIKT